MVEGKRGRWERGRKRGGWWVVEGKKGRWERGGGGGGAHIEGQSMGLA